MKTPQTSDAERQDDQLRRARQMLQAGRIADAAEVCRDILDVAPDSVDALYTLAVAHRLLRHFDDALDVIHRLITRDPANSRAYQEMGHCLRDQGDKVGALSAYQEAVARNNALLSSWQMLELYHAEAGRDLAADFASGQVEYLSSLPPELLSVASLIQEGKLYKAEQLCRHFLQTHGHHVEGMRFLAQIGMSFNVHDEAEFLLESAVVIAPDNVGAHFDYVETLQKRQKFAEALEQARLLRQKDPQNPQVDMLYANQNLVVGNFAEALNIYRNRADEMPNNPGIHLTLGHALKTTGEQKEAIAAYTRAYQIKPDFGDAYWSLANLKTYRFDESQIASMRDLEMASTTQLADRYHLCFALGKALEDHGQFDESFTYYERGNRLKREEIGYDWRRISKEIDRQIDH